MMDGIGSNAVFSELSHITIDKNGFLYALDANSVRLIDPSSGAVSTLVGNRVPVIGGFMDGMGQVFVFF